MGFYVYFRIAKYFCPRKLKPFAPAIYYEVARELEKECKYISSDHFYVTQKMLDPIYRIAYDRIVERIGDKIAAAHLQPTEEYVRL